MSKFLQFLTFPTALVRGVMAGNRSREKKKPSSRKRPGRGSKTDPSSKKVPNQFETVLFLQQTVGNKTVKRLLDASPDTQRADSRSPVTPSSSLLSDESLVSRAAAASSPVAAATAKAPDVAAMVAEQYPKLELPPKSVTLLQKIFNARYKVDRLKKVLYKYISSKSKYKPGFRETIERKWEKDKHFLIKHMWGSVWGSEGMHRLKVHPRFLLSGDIIKRKKGESIELMAARQSIYKRLLADPPIVVIQPGLNPRPLFRYRLGGVIVDHESGLISFKNLTRHPEVNRIYMMALMGLTAEKYGELAEMAESAGGRLFNATGKKVGERYGDFVDRTVKLGTEIGIVSGYKDDAPGRALLSSHMAALNTARAVVKAPDGYLHIYALDPPINAWDMDAPGADPYVYLLDKGSEIKLEEVITNDGRVLERGTGKAGSGWRTRKELSFGKHIFMGLILGDIIDDPSAKMIVTQILVGAIPGVGTAADARDVLAGMYKMWETGGDEGKVQTLMAMVGLIPLMGDGIKAARNARAAKKSAGEAFADATRPGLHEASESLARVAKKDPDAIAKKMGMGRKELSAETKALSDLAEELVGGIKAGAKKYAKKMTKYFNETGDAAFVVHMGGGKWSKVAKALQASSEGRKLGVRMERWRKIKLNVLKKEVKKRTAHLGSEGSPEMIRTGTGGFLSDADLSFMGPSATMHRNVAREVMDEMFGRHWKDLLDADIFADPKRLFLFEEVLPALGGKEARAIERRMASESELNVLGKMWLRHSDPGTVGKMAKKLGVGMDDVYRRAKEIGHMTKENIAKLELDMDVLHRRFLETTNTAEKARIAEEMAVLQGKLNAAVEGPYMTPGGAMKHVGRRELALRPKGPFAAMSPLMAYTAVLDDYYMLHRVFDDITHAGGKFSEKTAKSMAKYAERLVITAGYLGAIDVTARVSHDLFNTIGTLLKRSRSLGDRSALTAAKAHLEAAKVLMTKTIDDMSPALKKSLETYLASAPHAAKGPKSGKAFMALATELLNREKELMGRIFTLRVAAEGVKASDSEE